MKNTVILVGFVGNNPEVRTTQSGASITSISLATTRSYKDGDCNRQSETEWHRVTCFNGIGKSVAEHVTKGAIIMVTLRGISRSFGTRAASLHRKNWNEGRTNSVSKAAHCPDRPGR
jgi:single stranded DNA-binding protein